jgi:hypothetical protein
MSVRVPPPPPIDMPKRPRGRRFLFAGLAHERRHWSGFDRLDRIGTALK